MRRATRIIGIVIIALLALSWFALQTDPAKRLAKNYLETQLSQKMDATVHIGSVDGFLPFTIDLTDVACSRKTDGSKILTCGTLSLTPSWLELAFGNLALIRLSATDLDILEPDFFVPKTAVAPSASLRDRIAPFDISLYSFSLVRVKMPEAISLALSQGFLRGIDTGIVYDFSGSLFWKSTGRLRATFSCSPVAAEVVFGSCRINLRMDANQIATDINLDATQTPEGGVFVRIPCSDLSFQARLTGNTSDLFAETDPSSLLKGTWQASVRSDEQTRQVYPDLYGFSAEGTLAIENSHALTFDLDHLTTRLVATQAASRNQITSEEESFSTSYRVVWPAPANDIHQKARLRHLPFPLNAHWKGRFGWRAADGSITCSYALSNGAISFADFACTELHLTGTVATKANVWDATLDFATKAIRKNHSLPIALQASATYLDPTSITLKRCVATVGELTLQSHGEARLFPLSTRGAASVEGVITSLATFCDLPLRGALQGYSHIDGNELFFMAQGKELTLDALSCERLSLSANGDIAALQVACGIDQARFRGLTIDGLAHGTLEQPSPEKHHLRLTDCTLCSGSTPWKNDGPIDLAFGHAGIILEPFTIRDKESAISGFFHLTEAEATGQCSLTNIPLAPLLGTGHLCGQISLSGTPSLPELICRLSSSDFALSNIATHEHDYLPFFLNGEIGNGRFSFAAELRDPLSNAPLSGTLSFPGTFRLMPLAFDIDHQAPLQGEMKGGFLLETLIDCLFEEPQDIQGQVIVDMAIHGTWAEPHIGGTLKYQGGALEIPELGGPLRHVFAEARLEGTECFVDSITGTDGAEGTFKGHGTISLKDPFPFSFTLALHHMEGVELHWVVTKGSGTLTFSGDRTGGKLSGPLSLEHTAIFLNQIHPGLPEMEVSFLNEGKMSLAESSPFALTLDIKLDLADEGIIEGMGLDSTWTGHAMVSGTIPDVVVQGRVEAKSGHFMLANKRLLLRESHIDFAGDVLKDSRLNVTAQAYAGPILAQLLLRGPIENPRLELYSPPLSEHEILSWLLFNKSSSDITPIESLRLAKIAISLHEKTREFDPLERIKEKLHIDRIALATPPRIQPRQQDAMSEQNEVSLQVGKYLSEGVIVTLSKDITNEVNRVGIEANITASCSATAEVGDDAATELSLRWKHDY